MVTADLQPGERTVKLRDVGVDAGLVKLAGCSRRHGKIGRRRLAGDVDAVCLVTHERIDTVFSVATVKAVRKHALELPVETHEIAVANPLE